MPLDDDGFPPIGTFGPPPFVLVLNELPLALFVRPVLLAPCKAELPPGHGAPIHATGNEELSLDHHNRLAYQGRRPALVRFVDPAGRWFALVQP